ncbi:hypothetical protein [Microbacterium ulmi]|uniref:Uncharacterized protein n=1 Tax=Microbacterium ulmi TaxID=179095 RepID=A0A7Y2Q2C2_9MICO|nr:hypothetical protein [Microbacterium ulmi]NII68843.1 hypothetical protein [Microbacterium ulmi]NNH05277.1 hypothetical protein [Microbacterium ulmi]
MENDRTLPEGVIDATPPGGWEGIDDTETRERDAAASVEAPGPAPAAPEPTHTATGIGVLDTDADAGSGARAADETEPPASTADGSGPIMDQHSASDVDKIAGIVVQTRADVGTEPVERIAEVLGQRLRDAGLDLDDGEIADLARQVATGDA